ncbi:MAG: HEPN domain-containing protein [Candidatus Margulisiibacteriota bacterium]|nr:HEPN domain-containing protein [Candidatus Margulisiibacteriota bacterium]
MEQSKAEMIKAQIEKAEEKLGAAKVLSGKEYFDDAVSRAYYAAFHAASAVLLSEDITVESHSALKTMFGLHFVNKGKLDKRFGRFLNELKDSRESGDYDVYTGFEKNDAEKAINESQEFVEGMKDYLKL